MTSNATILAWLKGFKIPFISIPLQRKNVHEIALSAKDKDTISVLIMELKSKGAIDECEPVHGQFLSKIFTLPKADGSFRLILNVKELNEYINTTHFKMENYKTVINLMENGCYMSKIDLKDAYYTMPIAVAHRKFLRFKFDKKLYEFNCLPFGLNVAPLIFTKLLKPAVTFLREQGVILVIYLDDILIIGKNHAECERHYLLTSKTLKFLGFILHDKKCQPVPNQKCIYLGFLFDSQRMVLELPENRKAHMKKLIEDFNRKKQCKIRDFAQFIGSIIACCPAIDYSLLYAKELERTKLKILNEANGNYDAMMSLKDIDIQAEFWTSKIMNGHRLIRYEQYDLVIYSDASLSGWGVCCEENRSHGFWTKEEQMYSINYLELKAAFFGLKCFAEKTKNSNILLRIDNSTAIAYINRMGGTRYEYLNKITRDIWQWCEAHNNFVFASYIKSKENVEADEESRREEAEDEYELSNEAYEKIVKSFGHPQIDLFASRSNKKCDRFVSWKRDPESDAIDAFTLSWQDDYFYAFPPFGIILKVLRKIKRDKATGIVVIPDWRGQSWFPIFQKLLISEPLIFSPCKTLLTSSNRKPHPLSESLTLVAGILSGRP